MEQKKANRERSRKTPNQSKTAEGDQPSRAPRQDEDGRDVVGSGRAGTAQADGTSDKQGISNRPANEEHAFPGERRPDATEPDTSPVDEDPSTPQQQGGNRGRV